MAPSRTPAMLTQVPVESLKSSVTRPSKTKPLREVGGIGELQRVADLVVALLVEALRRLVGLLPVARRDVRPLAARSSSFSPSGTSLTSRPGRRQPDQAGAIDRPGGGEGERRGLGRAVAGDDQDALAGGAERGAVEAVPDVLAEAGARHTA